MGSPSPSFNTDYNFPGGIRNLICDKDGTVYADADHAGAVIVPYGSHSSLPGLPAWAAEKGGRWWYSAPLIAGQQYPEHGEEGETEPYSGHVFQSMTEVYWPWLGVLSDTPSGIALAPLLSLQEVSKLRWLMKGATVDLPDFTGVVEHTPTTTPPTYDTFTVPAVTLNWDVDGEDAQHVIEVPRRRLFTTSYSSGGGTYDDRPSGEHYYRIFILSIGWVTAPYVYRVWDTEGAIKGYFIPPLAGRDYPSLDYEPLTHGREMAYLRHEAGNFQNSVILPPCSPWKCDTTSTTETVGGESAELACDTLDFDGIDVPVIKIQYKGSAGTGGGPGVTSDVWPDITAVFYEPPSP